MKKTVAILICVGMVAALIVGCGGQANNSQAQAVPGVLRVGFLNGNDRFTGDVGGAPAGIEANIAQRIATNGGLSQQFAVVDDTARLFQGLESGEFDVVFGRIPSTESYLSNFAVSNYYETAPLFIVTPKYNYMNDLNILETGTVGVTIKVEPLYAQVSGSDKYPMQSYDDLTLLMEDIKSGRVSAGIVNEREAVDMMVDDGLQVQGLYNSPKESYVAAMQNNSSFVDAVNTAIYEYRTEKIGVSGAENEQG
ncbi:MAG: transporter substrate-binding domain-containing protein [Lachnospiraceae bacterium]|nr:transporter substrate-binding domain-containing protein [Lachnospiraceae bacterium]